MSILSSAASIRRLRGTQIRRRDTVPVLMESTREWDECKVPEAELEAADGARLRPAGRLNLGQIFFPSFNVGSKSERMAAKPERGKMEKRGGGKKTRVARPTRRTLNQ